MSHKPVDEKDTEVSSLLRDAFLDLQQQPLPGGLRERIAASLQQPSRGTQAHVRAHTHSEEQSLSEGGSDNVLSTVHNGATEVEPEIGEPESPSSEEGVDGPCTAVEQPTVDRRSGLGWLLVGLCVLLLLPLAPWKSTLQQTQVGTELPGRVSKSGAVVEMHHSLKTAQGFVVRHKTDTQQRLAPGDLIQFHYEAIHAPLHIMIVSLNERGEVSPYIPFEKKSSIQIKGEGRLPKTGSLVLDGYIGLERVFVLTAGKRFSLTRVKRSLTRAFEKAHRRLAVLQEVPGPWNVRTYLLRKQHRSGGGDMPQ